MVQPNRAYLVTPSSPDAEAQQLRFAELAAAAGVRHLVKLSQFAADEASPVRFLRYHAAVERRIRELGIGFTFLRPNLYFQGLLAFQPMIAKNGRFVAPIGDARVSAVDVRDIAAVAATVLTQPGHEGKTYTITGPTAVTHHEMADYDYLRILVRGSYYRSLGPLVLASNARWGELTRLGGVPPLTVFDLFFKGGGTQTVRGYKQDELSGYDVMGIPVGGTRLVVFNQEIRVPIAGIFKGVLFADAGNTFADRTSFSLSDLAVGVGFGLRIRTPLAPIRIDLGYPLPGRPSSSLRWHFSIGQMF